MRTTKLTILSCVAICLAIFTCATNQAQAQSTNKPAAKKTEKSGQKSAHPFHGKLAASDQAAKTITIGKSVYQITSETKISKAGKPAVLADGVVGEEASGYAKPMEGGKMYAATLNFGPKPEKAEQKKKKE